MRSTLARRAKRAKRARANRSTTVLAICLALGMNLHLMPKIRMLHQPTTRIFHVTAKDLLQQSQLLMNSLVVTQRSRRKRKSGRVVVSASRSLARRYVQKSRSTTMSEKAHVTMEPAAIGPGQLEPGRSMPLHSPMWRQQAMVVVVVDHRTMTMTILAVPVAAALERARMAARMAAVVVACLLMMILHSRPSPRRLSSVVGPARASPSAAVASMKEKSTSMIRVRYARRPRRPPPQARKRRRAVCSECSAVANRPTATRGISLF